MKVNVTNKATGKVKCRVRFEHVATDSPPNVILPTSAFKEVLYKTGDVKALVHLEKKVSYLPWTPLRVIVESFDTENPSDSRNENTTKNLTSKDFTITVIDDHFNPQSAHPVMQMMQMGPSAGICMSCMHAFDNNQSNNCPNCGVDLNQAPYEQWDFANEA